jgi:hypothetical protein
MSALFCELVEGRSETRTWALPRKGEDALRIVVGSAANATWQVIAAGVRPHHVEIAWNDGAGWVLNRGGASDVKLGGRAVTQEWQRVEVPVRLEFGHAVLQMRASQGPQPIGDFESTHVVVEALEEPRTSEPDTAPSERHDSFPAPNQKAMAAVLSPGKAGSAQPSVIASGAVSVQANATPSGPASSGVRPSGRPQPDPKSQPVVRRRFLVLALVVVAVVTIGMFLSKNLPNLRELATAPPPAVEEPQSAAPVFELPEPTVTAYEATPDPEIAALEARAIREFAAGQLGDAIASYEDLNRRRPEHRGFRVALEVLREHCRDGGRECVRSE